MEQSKFERGAGVLCHISSLPGKYGIGTLGKEAYDFADFLAKAKVKYWQILPLVQTGYGDSPYQSVDCLSGNPYFIDLEALYKEGLLDEDELKAAQMPEGDVDYDTLYQKRYTALRLAYARFNIKNKKFVAFIESGEFEDYAIFMSLKERYGCSFDEFPDAYKYKEHLAIYEFRRSVYKTDYCFWLFVQFIFRKQWKKLKAYVNSLGIQIVGDIPLYVAYDSADVWGRPELFELDDELKPTAVAGVPPDYFSKTGQLWGNPLYNWDALAAENYEWWVKRVQSANELYDIIRIDHFRGLDRYYAIPADAATAEVGEWRDGPKQALFQAIEKKLGKLPFIAEDLGVMDDGVIALREKTDLPGMKIVLFAFNGEADNDYLPHNIGTKAVAYTGTHDNDTALGFVHSLSPWQLWRLKTQLREELKGEGVDFPIVDDKDLAKALDIAVLGTKADLAILPIQDVLLLDSDARMNTPSTTQGNWSFRLKTLPTRADAAFLRKYIRLFER
jgi:4-alpha-glucanotransferase